jgi:outer membrane receptor protein involved in Fe transport
MSSRVFRLLCNAAALLFFAVPPLVAQSTGAITGTVRDPTGAPVPNATITVTNNATGASQTFKTDNAGLYLAPALPPTNYKVQVRSAGMATAIANEIVVSVGSTVRQDFKLQLGATSQSIQIEATPPLVESTSTSVGTTINQRTVQEIPLNGRHFVDLALLIPGSVTPPQNGFLTAPLRGQGSFAFNSAGAREDQVNFQINGIQMSDISQNQITFQPTINTVDEFTVDNSTYSAEYGRNSGSIVNIATRQGTNALHGELYDYLRNNDLDARNFGNPVGQPMAPFKRNQFGGDGGGPLKKNNSFLFLSYEGLRQRQNVPLAAVVPSASQRVTTDPIIQKLLPMIPLPNQGNEYVSTAVAPVNIDQGTADFTQVFSESNHFNAYYAMQHDQRNEPPTTQANNLPGYGDRRQGWRQLLTLNDAQVISPTLVNEARAGFNRIHITFNPENTLNAADLGMNTGVNAPIGLPQIFVSGWFTFGGINGFPQGRGDDTITLSDTVSWVHGTHSIKFGPEMYDIIADSFSSTPGTFTFPSLTAFLADQASAFTANSSNHSTRAHEVAIGAFVQDDWKISSRLTLDLGLRYDFFGTPTEAENRFVVFNPALDALQRVGVNGGPAHAYQENAKNFEPRVGFAFDPTGTGKTVIRSAYAIFVDQPTVGLVGGLVSNPPFAQPVSFSPTAGVPSVSFADAYSAAGGIVSPSSVAQNYRDSYTQSWNFNIQQQVGTNASLMVGYFGSKGTDLNIARNYNQFINGVRPYPTLSLSSSIDPGSRLGNITVYESDGNSSYNGLWITGTKRYSRGLLFNASYTLSKSIDYNSRNVQGVVIQNSYDIAGNRGLSDFDARNRFTFDGVYDLPFTHNRLVSGWEIALIAQVQSGNPINFHTTNSAFTGLTTLRPSVTGPVITGYSPATNGSATAVSYIQNQTVFYNQGNAFGNLGRNTVIGPGFADVDVALVKTTAITERISWEIRADAFDVLNQANFGQPGTSAAADVFPSPSFNLILGTRFPPGDSGSSRQLQLSMKLRF